MLMFTLAISCLITANLPWFMDLTFQVPMQNCSLQHRTLLPSPVTSTTGHCFFFDSVSSFFLELFLHWSSVACLAPTDLGSSSLSDLSFCLAGSYGSSIFIFLRNLHTRKADYLTCLLKNLHADQEITLRTRHGTMDLFQIGKGIHQGCILSSCLFNMCRLYHVKCQPGWLTSWNHVCPEK